MVLLSAVGCRRFVDGLSCARSWALFVAAAGSRRLELHWCCKGTTSPLRFTNTRGRIFSFSEKSISMTVSARQARICFTCYSVTVLERLFHTLKILLYLYINIELIFDFHRIYFGTATLQHCNNRNTLITSKTFKKLHKKCDLMLIIGKLFVSSHRKT